MRKAFKPTECRKNRFVLRIEGVDLPEWLVTDVSYCGGKLVVTYREVKEFFSSEFFDNNGQNVVNTTAKLEFLDEVGVVIGDAVFTGVSFETMQMDKLSYKDDSILCNTVYFAYNDVKHRSI